MTQAKEKKLMVRVRERIRTKGYAKSMEKTYAHWIRKYIYFHGIKHPMFMGVAEIEAFLTDMAVRQHMSPSSQNQALNAILFLYKEILQIELDGQVNAVRAKRRRTTPRPVSSRPGPLAPLIVWEIDHWYISVVTRRKRNPTR
jgi:hypothetical protein